MKGKGRILTGDERRKEIGGGVNGGRTDKNTKDV